MKYFFYGQDSNYISEDILKSFKFENNDIRYSRKKNGKIFNFVGFFINKNKILSVFPKKYFKYEEIKKINNMNYNDIILTEDIKLLFNVISKYISTKNFNNNNNNSDFYSNYPFEVFFDIYNYYKKFGLYKELNNRKVKSYTGNICWKDTIEKSSKIISGKNLIYIPFYTNKLNSETVFISECMVYVINYTIELFPSFLNLNKINYNSRIKTKFNNLNFIIGKLQSLKISVFKDYDKKLIDDLIVYFSILNKNHNLDNIVIKINYFDRIWEKMIEEYLNCNFKCIDVENKKIIFEKNNLNKNNFKIKTFIIDQSKNKYRITLDHYAVIDKKQYIFDSKYYEEVGDLNYKQLVYHEILKKNKIYEDTFSAIILPGFKEDTVVHYELSENFIHDDKESIIFECYLNVKEVMRNYIKN